MINPYNQKIDEYPSENGFNSKKDGRVLGWISGGIASAIACHYAIEKYGDRVDLVFCNTAQEDPDTFRFMADLEKHWGRKIKIISSDKFKTPVEVQDKYIGLNFAHGAPCSNELKQRVRVAYQDLDSDFGHIFGYDDREKEKRRARDMISGNPELNPIFPLIAEGIDRFKIHALLKKWGITPPRAYENFENNNCLGDPKSEIGGCIQGGIGYWQQMRDVFPRKYDWNGMREHKLTRDKIQKNITRAATKDNYRFYKDDDSILGWKEERFKLVKNEMKWVVREMEPVTCCKSQSAKYKHRLFLTKCPDFPNVKTIDIIKGRRPIIMQECNGFCGIDNQLELF